MQSHLEKAKKLFIKASTHLQCVFGWVSGVMLDSVQQLHLDTSYVKNEPKQKTSPLNKILLI